MPNLSRTVSFLAIFIAAQAAPAFASVDLLAMGALTGPGGANTDLSGLTGVLENGVSAAMLGGTGSAIAYAGNGVFLAAPDRGPNALAYNPAVDDTVSYISRFNTVKTTLTANPGSGGLPFSLGLKLAGTTLLWSGAPLNYGAGVGSTIGGQPMPYGGAVNSAGKYYFTGRSDNFSVVGGSGNASDARLDPEGMRVSNDGKSVFVSDEYGPYVYQIDRATGRRIKSFTLPANLYVANPSPVGATEISGNTSGRVANKGMEGLAITPDGKTLVGILQASTIQDAAGNAGKLLRIVTIDIATGATHEYGYNLTTGTGVSEIVAINDHEFLVDERDGKGLGDGSSAKVKDFFAIDLDGAADISDLTGAAAAAKAVAKSKLVDFVAVLKAAGVSADKIPAKIEGLAFGDDVTVDGAVEHTLWVANDNDFVPDTSGPNMFYVLGLTDKDLAKVGATFQGQAIAAVPEPSTWAMLFLGFAGLGLAGRRGARGRSGAAV